MPYSEKILLLAGAGASVHLGLPSLDDLLRQAVLGNDDVAERIRQTRNSIESTPKRFKSAVFEELIIKIKDYLKVTHTLKTDTTYRRELSGIPHGVDNGHVEMEWKSALTRCYRVLLEEYGPTKINVGGDAFRITLELLQELAELNGNSLHLFTTNYDCSPQVLAAKTNNLNFLSHIDNIHGRFRDTWFSSRKELEGSTLPQIYVHRLHGCVAWFTACGGDEDLWDTCGVIKEVYGAGEHIEIRDDNFLSKMCIKLVASQLLGTNPVFATAFEEFSELLRNASILLVWGYSFRDLEVLRQINSVISGENTKLQVYFVDPFLSAKAVVTNIRNTFDPVPIQPSPSLMPQKIEWCSPDGYPNLLTQVKETIMKGLANDKRR